VVLATQTPLILVRPAPQAARISITDVSGAGSGAIGVACAEETTSRANTIVVRLFIADLVLSPEELTAAQDQTRHAARHRDVDQQPVLEPVSRGLDVNFAMKLHMVSSL